MTTTSTAEPPVAEPRPRNWGDIAVGYANEISSARFGRGDLAALRRMNPDAPDAAVFYRLLAQQDLLGSEIVERKWALILHGIALMTRTTGDDMESRSAHKGKASVGSILYLGGDTERPTAFYSEIRFNRLLTARGDMLFTLLARLFRMLASQDGCAFNWREMAQFILNAGYNEDAAERSRRQLARAYYQTARRNSPQS